MIPIHEEAKRLDLATIGTVTEINAMTTVKCISIQPGVHESRIRGIVSPQRKSMHKEHSGFLSLIVTVIPIFLSGCQLLADIATISNTVESNIEVNVLETIDLEFIWQKPGWSGTTWGLCMAACLEIWERWEFQKFKPEVNVPDYDYNYVNLEPNGPSLVGYEDRNYDRDSSYKTKFEIFDQLPLVTWIRGMIPLPMIKPLAWGTTGQYYQYVRDHPQVLGESDARGVRVGYDLLMKAVRVGLYNVDGSLRSDARPAIICTAGNLPEEPAPNEPHSIVVGGLTWNKFQDPRQIAYINPGDDPSTYFSKNQYGLVNGKVRLEHHYSKKYPIKQMKDWINAYNEYRISFGNEATGIVSFRNLRKDQDPEHLEVQMTPWEAASDTQSSDSVNKYLGLPGA